MVLISVVVIGADADTVTVILVAQVFNGCLLPFFSVCLLLCINDRRFMKGRPQKGWCNIFLVTVVYLTFVLTFTTLLQNMFSWTYKRNHLSRNTFDTAKFV